MKDFQKKGSKLPKSKNITIQNFSQIAEEHESDKSELTSSFQSSINESELEEKKSVEEEKK